MLISKDNLITNNYYHTLYKLTKKIGIIELVDKG